MRKILFRGREIDNNKWVYGDLQSQAIPLTSILTYKQDFGYGDLIPVSPTSVGQFTGLTDKNGTKIFDGDIIKLCKCKNDICILKGGNPNYYFQGKNGYYEMSEEPHSPECFEVIGNIYENPELIQ